jgi:hypothetical protein
MDPRVGYVGVRKTGGARVAAGGWRKLGTELSGALGYRVTCGFRRSNLYIYIYIKSLHHTIHHVIQCFEPGHVAFFQKSDQFLFAYLHRMHVRGSLLHKLGLMLPNKAGAIQTSGGHERAEKNPCPQVLRKASADDGE